MTPPEADELFVLSEGKPNQLEGIWPDRRYYAIGRLELHFFRSRKSARAQALIFPGGGYLDLVHDKEGLEIAVWLSTLGIDSYVVTHRLPGTRIEGTEDIRPFDIALQDGLSCLQFLKSKDGLPLIHVGMSSGGHMAGVMACQTEIVPATGVLMAYAPINANHCKYKAPEGKPDYPPVEKQDFYNAWPLGIVGEPHAIPPVPCFLAYALHDQPVPIDHALNFIKTMQSVHGDVEAHIFPDAPHGFALRDLKGSYAQWPILAARWIDRILSQRQQPNKA